LSHRSCSSIIDLIRATWAEVLKLENDSLGPDDDFFEMGGHSLMGASAVALLGERLRIDLPPRAIFEAPTPAEMAELVDELLGQTVGAPAAAVKPSLPEWVVPLQREGAGLPVFVFPPADGGIQALTSDAQIAAAVGRRHPFWGFQRDHPELESARLAGITTLAAEYVKQMRAIQGDGPFLLYAGCAGGRVAWEAAGQLLAAGEPIAGILFYNVPLLPDFDAALPGFTPAHITPVVYQGAYYRPRALRVDLTLLVTQTWQTQGWSASWQRVAQGSLETIVIPSPTPMDYMDTAKWAERIGNQLRLWIEKAEARAGCLTMPARWHGDESRPVDD
jgi:acyl carrier protein